MLRRRCANLLLRRERVLLESVKAFATAPPPSDLYVLLGVQPSASAEDIKKAYRREALRWHPDRHEESTRSEAEARFKAVSQAYQTLSDANSRAVYDSERRSRTAYGTGRQQAQQTQQTQRSQRARPPPQWERPPQWQEASPFGGMPGGGFSRDEADRLFREMFGSASGVAELLRRMQVPTNAGGRMTDDFFEAAARAAAGAGARGGAAPLQTTIIILPDGRRVLRTTRVVATRDGRQQILVEDEELPSPSPGSSRRAAAAQQEPSGVGGVLQRVAGPVLAAVAVRVGEAAVRLATRAVVSFATAVVRRVLGGRR